MIQFDATTINSLAVHYVGNKSNDEPMRCSDKAPDLNEKTKELLVKYFTGSFINKHEYFNLHHEINLDMNEVFRCVGSIFDDPGCLHEQSANLVKHLYEHSSHPKVKAGEFYTVYFEDCVLDGEKIEVVGLFKSENKETFLKVYPHENNYEINNDWGININKLDKGCLIFNTEKDKGYLLQIVDQSGKGAEALYWTDDFLQIRPRKDEYHCTENVLTLCKNFVKNELPQKFEISKADQVEFLNKSVKFFKENDNFNMNEFADEVMVQPEIISSFNEYKSAYQRDYDVEIADDFEISESAVKKQARSFKSVIKLDKNFHIYIHGNRNMIEHGEDNKGKFYKVYYKEES
ncbi:MAG: hypothetical protein A2W91_00155 [Bacteroidetes bacterium GWF2_38_335]|nr:MAG: hypothetical protein A2W91_00155 [Bacteroidetes bacterium GWF2_38_335]OFY79733.1 MAG: hypothetical protein A2281_09750 [Bacteroidetes bacterium RIFOXYA12_FULL_38_20]HBS87561.1 hypothetical protein [Bacteroidales bacterium]